MLLAWALAWWAPPAAARPLEPPLQMSQYAHTAWTPRDGAALGLVLAMAQTPDGYLWIAGSGGLFRFDGLQFQLWQPPDGQTLPSGPYSLVAASDGTLWIGTYSGLSSWDGQRFVRRHAEVGMGFVTSLLEDREGTVWAGIIGEPSRLCAARAGQIECTTAEGRFGSFVWSLAEDREGRLWVGAESGVWQWRPGEPRRYPMAGLRVGDLTTTADGQVLAGVYGGGLMALAGDRLVPHRFERAGAPGQWMAGDEIKSNKLLRDRDGGLWIGSSGNGLIHVKDGQADTLTRAEGLSGNIACSLFEDREGNIWFGSERGLDRFRKLPVTTLSTQQGLPGEVIHSVLSTTDGSIWVGTNDGLARWKDGSRAVYQARHGLPGSQVRALYEDADGRLWVSTDKGVAYLAGERFVPVAAGPSTEVYVITGDAAGNLWLSGNQGLAHLQRGRFVENTPWSAFGRKRPAQVLIADRGGLWMSFWDTDGVSYLKNGVIETTYAAAQGLGEGIVMGMRLDEDGVMWAGTGKGGLSRIQGGRITSLSTANGLPCNFVHWSIVDNAGALWMFTACGLVRLTAADVAAWVADPTHRVTPKVWTAAEGVPLQLTPAGYHHPPVAKGADGRIWFVGGADVHLVAPADMPYNPVPPPVYVVSLVADHQPQAVADGLRLPPLVRDITVEFAALTLADPKSTRFRWRLEGHDTDWREAVDRRVASYTNLPPGDYRFQVKAANHSGVWNEQGASLAFSIEPAYYQTTWFRVASVLVPLGLAWAGFHLWLRLRIRRLQREFEATLDARVAERTRIARDLHDTLLQRFHGLLLQFQAAFNLLPDRPRESRQVLARAIDQVAEAITEGRDTVHALRTSVVESNHLADALRGLAEDLAAKGGQAVQVNVEVQGTPQALHPLVRDETFRIAAEALRNAFHHAEARRVEVSIHYGERQLRVRVRDDGKGIEPEVLRLGSRPGHFGLSGMRERAELAGGTLQLRSAAGTGTVVEFQAPAERAYSRVPPARSRWFQKKLSSSETGQ
ncbi:MAG: hypothetical protein HY856_13210 [Burkholderiales bacterium]|nr:hypothetical protein [Burkholderiales bacterium]